MQKKHPRLAFWFTVVPAALGAGLAVYHLFEVARTIANPSYTPMLGGFTGSIYLVFDYFAMSLPICALLFTALLLNLLWSQALGKAWGYSVLASCAVFLICGMWIILDSSGALAVSLNLAARVIAESLTAVPLVHSLTKKK
jgi:hypothetical protein